MSFFQGNVLLINVLLGPPVVPIHEVQMKPCFVKATFDRWDVNQAFSVGRRMRHAYALSKNGENPVV